MMDAVRRFRYVYEPGSVYFILETQEEANEREQAQREESPRPEKSDEVKRLERERDV